MVKNILTFWIEKITYWFLLVGGRIWPCHLLAIATWAEFHFSRPQLEVSIGPANQGPARPGTIKGPARPGHNQGPATVRVMLGLGIWHAARAQHGPLAQTWLGPSTTNSARARSTIYNQVQEGLSRAHNNLKSISFGWPNILRDACPCVSPSVHHKTRHPSPNTRTTPRSVFEHERMILIPEHPGNSLSMNMRSLSSTSFQVPQNPNPEIH